jgi:hypothetical protein
MAKGTRITVDLGSEELLKAMKIAAVEDGEPIRVIVIEALKEWLERRETARGKEPGVKDLRSMMQAVSEYRKTAGLT